MPNSALQATNARLVKELDVMDELRRQFEVCDSSCDKGGMVIGSCPNLRVASMRPCVFSMLA